MTIPRPLVLQAAALVGVGVVVLGIAAGRPDADRFRVTQPAAPDCAGQNLASALGHSDLVLSGTATQVSSTSVLIKPDHYFYGAPDWAPLTLQIDRTGPSEITWTSGERYLVFTAHGQLSECGQTQPWNQAAVDQVTKHYG